MKGVKKAAAIISIIEGALGILGGIIVILVGALFNTFGDMIKDFITTITDDVGYGYNIDWSAIQVIFQTALIFAGIIVLLLAVAKLILGIKFNGNKPNKGIAIALLVLNIVGAMGLLSVAVIVLTIVYLVLLGKHPEAYEQNT